MRKRLPNEPYVKVNLILAGILGLIFVYSGLFSPDKAKHPVPSSFKFITKENTTSTGLSRAFSEIVRLNFNKAKKQNPYSLKVFGFFFVQFILRLLLIPVSFHVSRKKILIFTDVSVSVIMFIVCFLDFLKQLYQIPLPG